ncbi:MAG TPA: short-chain fatty acyl-CoA regulator family protein [Novosphingobium sp.]|nr:short-chain fatty acyl-CoA regulator family protein [Novosphingobium sp.]
MSTKPLYLGPRVKRLRREMGLTQQAMAEDLGISASYVALIERNQRPVTADLLLRLARNYKLDIADIAADDSADTVRRLTDVLRDPIFADIDLPALEIADLAASFPGMTEALMRLYGAYTREQARLADLSADGEQAPGTTGAVGEARRFIAAQRNYFPTLDTRAEALANAIAETGDMRAFLAQRHGIRTRLLPPPVMMGAIRRFDRHNQQLLLDDTMDAPTRQFQLALQIAYSECRSDITALLRAGGLSSPTATNLVRRALAGYVAAAILMPYTRFARAVEERAYDIEALSRLFGTSFEQTAHRLTTLSRPGEERVPFFFLRVDAAGNVSKRLDGAGFPFAAHGGGCPLWNVHNVFGRPRQILTQWLELPDGQQFFSIARAVEAGGGAWGRPRVERAVALACAAEHAPRLIYAQGADPRRATMTPIGVSCRLCHRPDCAARALPPIGREIVADDYRRANVPFGFAEG